jgi:hypothetical protein
VPVLRPERVAETELAGRLLRVELVPDDGDTRKTRDLSGGRVNFDGAGRGREELV